QAALVDSCRAGLAALRPTDGGLVRALADAEAQVTRSRAEAVTLADALHVATPEVLAAPRGLAAWPRAPGEALVRAMHGPVTAATSRVVFEYWAGRFDAPPGMTLESGPDPLASAPPLPVLP